MTFLKIQTQQEKAQILSSYLRNDDIFQASRIEDTNQNKVLYSLAPSFIKFDDILNRVYEQYFINITSDLLEFWERAVGIPDSCIDTDYTVEERRQNVLFKLAGINVSTAKEFENIAVVLGLENVRVLAGDTDGVSRFTFIFPFRLLSEEDLPFTILVDIPTVYDAPEYIDKVNILKCIFTKIKPAQCVILFAFKD